MHTGEECIIRRANNASRRRRLVGTARRAPVSIRVYDADKCREGEYNLPLHMRSGDAAPRHAEREVSQLAAGEAVAQ